MRASIDSRDAGLTSAAIARNRIETLPPLWAAGIALLGFIVRAAVAFQLGATPFYEQPQLDSFEFLVWARSIAEGDLFRWTAPSHGPGYALFLALLLSLFGDSLRAIALVQAILGAASCVITAWIAARMFQDRRAGVAAGLIQAVYGPLIYLEVSLFAEGLFTFLLIAALWLFTRPQTGTRQAVSIGLLLGAAAITRATALPLCAALAGWTLLGRSHWPRKAAWWMLAGWMVCVVPVLLVLRQTSGGWLPVQAFGGLNFYMGNHPEASGTPEARLGGTWDLLHDEPARHGITGETERERYFFNKALREIRERPFGTLRALGRKSVWLLQNDEVRDNYQFFCTQSALLRWLPGFGVLLPMALCGLWIAWSKRRLPFAIALHLLFFVATNILIVVSCRYRIPLIPVLAAIAGGAVVWLIDKTRRRQWRELWPATAIVTVAVIVSRLWIHQPSRDFSEEWALTAGSLHTLGRTTEAHAAIDRALSANPNSALAWYHAGLLQLAAQDLNAAETAFANAARFSPYHHRARLSLGLVYKQKGDLEWALRELRQAHSIVPNDPKTMLALGEVLLDRGDIDHARPLLRGVVQRDPHNERAWLALARLEGAARNAPAGIEMATKAVAINASQPEAWMLLAMLALDAGNAPVADRAIANAERLMGVDAPSVGFARALLDRLRGKPRDADRRLRSLLRRFPNFQQAAQLLVANAAELGQRAEAETFLRTLGR